MKKRWTIAFSIVTVALGGISVMAACSEQQEGEVCSVANGNDDCNTDDNLQCDPANELNNVISDRCCPVNRALATHPACIIPVAVVGSDAAAPTDTGPPSTPIDATTDQ